MELIVVGLVLSADLLIVLELIIDQIMHAQEAIVAQVGVVDDEASHMSVSIGALMNLSLSFKQFFVFLLNLPCSSLAEGNYFICNLHSLGFIII